MEQTYKDDVEEPNVFLSALIIGVAFFLSGLLLRKGYRELKYKQGHIKIEAI